jgi:hypothetical protein
MGRPAGRANGAQNLLCQAAYKPEGQRLTLLLVPLTQPHPGATAVLVDEFDTRVFEGSANG